MPSRRRFLGLRDRGLSVMSVDSTMRPWRVSSRAPHLPQPPRTLRRNSSPSATSRSCVGWNRSNPELWTASQPRSWTGTLSCPPSSGACTRSRRSLRTRRLGMPRRSRRDRGTTPGASGEISRGSAYLGARRAGRGGLGVQETRTLREAS